MDSNKGLWRDCKRHTQGDALSGCCATVLPVYDSTLLSMLGWHPREDFIFMFANLPPYLPKVAINTLLCLPEKYLKEQFVRVLYGLAWQYS